LVGNLVRLAARIGVHRVSKDEPLTLTGYLRQLNEEDRDDHAQDEDKDAAD
jgi:hypothetical protein